MWERLTAPDRTFFKTPLFLVSFWFPVTISMILFGLIAFSDGLGLSIMGGSEAYSLMVERMKVPLIVLSLSVPLSGLVAANHRSMQLVKTIQGQERKRMYDLYYDHQKEFCITLGRVIVTEEWEYIQDADLPLIHRSAYRHNVDELNDKFSPHRAVIASLDSFVEEASKFIENQGHAILEGMQHDSFEETLDTISVTFEVLISNINRLRKFLMIRPLKNGEKYLVVLKAVCELDLLREWFGENRTKEVQRTINDDFLNSLLMEISKHTGFHPQDLDKGSLIASLELFKIREKDS